MNDTIYPAVPCPHCGYENECASNLEDPTAVPGEGDISLCIKCAGFSIFTGVEIQVRKPTEEEQAEIESDHRMMMMKAAVEFAQRQRKATA